MSDRPNRKAPWDSDPDFDTLAEAFEIDANTTDPAQKVAEMCIYSGIEPTRDFMYKLNPRAVDLEGALEKMHGQLCHNIDLILEKHPADVNVNYGTVEDMLVEVKKGKGEKYTDRLDLFVRLALQAKIVLEDMKRAEI